MKETAVEWFLTEFQKQVWFEPNSELDMWVKDLIPKAIEMEREQMKDSYKQGFAYRDTWNWELEVDWDEDSTQENNQEFEQYYKETFNPKSNESI
jgi:hypothetical protein